MSFADDVRRFAAKVEQRGKDIHDGVCDLAYQEIVDGGPVTGAPGQLVQTGFLRSSWTNEITGPLQRTIQTNAVYALEMEEGTRAGRALVQRSPRGGFHSVALVRLGWARIVEVVTRRVVGNA